LLFLIGFNTVEGTMGEMDETSIFDDLVLELSTEERRDLLERILAKAAVSNEPLYSPGIFVREVLPDYSAKLKSLGFFARIFVFIRSILTGRPGDDILRDDDLRDLGRSIELRAPGIIDRRRSLLLPGFAEELRRLRDSARFFYDVLERSVEHDKAAFFAFLGSIELPDMHRRLLDETNPEAVASRKREPSESEVRDSVFASFESAMDSLTEGGRRTMYHDLRSVLFLKRLASFMFERLLSCYREQAGGGEAASFGETRELLLELGDLLYSMSTPPSKQLMEALFVFAERDELAKEGKDAESLIGADLGKAESALERIRAFNAKIPVAELLKLVSGDPAYSPRELAGGEDWVAIYRGFWRDRIERELGRWRDDRRFNELSAEIELFVGEPGPSGFARISREGTAETPPQRFETALSFIDAFYRGPLLREMGRTLKIVLLEGEFYRKDNRIEFTDAYDGLLKIPVMIAALEARLAPEGDLGSSWLQAKVEMAPLQLTRRRLQSITRSAEEEGEAIVRKIAACLATMVRVIGGLLKGEAGGRYDSLSNLSYIDGKANKEFQKSLGLAKDRCEKAFSLLAEISDLDLDLRG
jgi:hypothetical protein